ncbi:hypothetical protein H4217_001832 [Coemansia sp. RSA 1939]|nr:hypothetical protein H4217_001832 [Coemansia sp. RSA 1939]KAJ2617348.1 hypothetical protein EV177_000597 [Coemansia sp. RSA 1804]
MPRERGIASRSKQGGNAEPMNIDIDIAGKIGLAIDPDIFSSTTETATAANIAYVQAMNEDDYGSDDDLGDSEAMQAAKLRTGLRKEIERFDADLEKELLEADRRDYEANGEVLDQEVVAKKMKLLSSFASHLRQIGKNRANLLARLANPLAEEHWMLDSAYHQRMVDAVQSMCKIVNRLPEISEAARHCLSAPVPGSERSDGSLDVSSSADPRSRQIAQMERLVHEVQQAFEWIENGKTSSDTASILPTVSL